ncbi:MAG: beta-galactosidase, partial [Planctomycetes bacterium]|nr:beta-galactosidase [Planctomycetota bacterium]
QAATFSFASEEKLGTCLGIGPWHTGQWGIRCESRQRFANEACTVRGYYRTEAPVTFQTAVGVLFYRGKQKLNGRRIFLPPAEKWTPFEFFLRVRHPAADSLTISLGLTEKSEGTVWFAGVTHTPGAAPLKFSDQEPALTRPAPPAAPARGKYFRLEQSGDTWWLVRPDGRPFYSTGTDVYSVPKDSAERERVLGIVASLRQAGFNSLGGWSNVSSWAPVLDDMGQQGQAPLAAFRSLQAGTMKAEFDCLAAPGGTLTPAEHGFADPFDPRYEQALRSRVRDQARYVKGKPWFAAWFADNEIRFEDLYRRVASPHCAETLLDFLQRKYGGDIGRLNTAWDTRFASFEDLAAHRPDPILRRGPIYADFRAFSRQTVRRHVEVTLRVIREEDPGRLVFSQRFMLSGLCEALDYLDLFAAYDGIAVNMYPSNQRFGLSEAEKAVLRTVHQKTGRPILLTEWSIPALDSGLYQDPDRLDWSWEQVVSDQAQRAAQAAHVAADHYNLPFLVGSHWFTLRDFNNEKRQANRGLYRSDGEPWPELIQALGRVQNRLAGR